MVYWNGCRSPHLIPVVEAQSRQVGPLVGGLLSRPADRFPGIFGENTFLKEHPYFLSCAVPASLTALVWIIAFLFLKESTSSPKTLTLFPWRKPNSPRVLQADNQDPCPLTSLLTYDVVVTSGNYASVALIDIAFRSLLPVFLSTPIPLGGLGLTPPTIGKILFLMGCLNGMQPFYFAQVNNRWGTRNIFMLGVTSTLPAIALFPIVSSLTRHFGHSLVVWLVLALQISFFSFLNLCFGAYR